MVLGGVDGGAARAPWYRGLAQDDVGGGESLECSCDALDWSAAVGRPWLH